MEQGPYTKADNRSATGEIPRLMEINSSLPCFQESATDRRLEPAESCPHFHILLASLVHASQNHLSPVLSTKMLMNFFTCLPTVPHIIPM